MTGRCRRGLWNEREAVIEFGQKRGPGVRQRIRNMKENMKWSMTRSPSPWAHGLPNWGASPWAWGASRQCREDVEMLEGKSVGNEMETLWRESTVLSKYLRKKPVIRVRKKINMQGSEVMAKRQWSGRWRPVSRIGDEGRWKATAGLWLEDRLDCCLSFWEWSNTQQGGCFWSDMDEELSDCQTAGSMMEDSIFFYSTCKSLALYLFLI